MNCFYHPTTVSVGLCKSCGKGLCPSCAVDLGKGLACANRCEADVKEYIVLMDRAVKRSPLNDQLVKAASSTRFMTGIFEIIFGTLFIGFALYKYSQEETMGSSIFFGTLGLAFVAYGVTILVKSGNIPKK